MAQCSGVLQFPSWQGACLWGYYMTPTTVCLSPIPKKLCIFQHNRAKQHLKANLRGFYRRKVLGIACAAVPITRQLHYCPSLSYFRNKTSSLPHNSGKCFSGTFHTPPFTALELNHKRSSCRFSFQKHPGQVEVWGPREWLGLTLLPTQTWVQK